MINEGILLPNKLTVEGMEIERLFGAYFNSNIKTQEDFTNISELIINSNDAINEVCFGEYHAFKQDNSYPTLLERVYKEGAILRLGATDKDSSDLIRVVYFFVSPKEDK